MPPSAPDDSVLSVTALTRGLSDLVEAHYDDVWVEGELSHELPRGTATLR